MVSKVPFHNTLLPAASDGPAVIVASACATDGVNATSANVDRIDRSVAGAGVCFVPFKVGLQGNLECLRRRDGPTKKKVATRRREN